MEKDKVTKSDLMLQVPSIFASFPNLVTAQSTRHGGVSPFPYSSLNLGLNTKDDKQNVLENRRRFFAALGFEEKDSAGSHQVHGDKVLKVDQPGYHHGYDSLITNKPQILLTVTVADCVPVLLYDVENQAIAVIHAGWKGTVAGIVENTLNAMLEHFKTKPNNCRAFIGTCIDECSFEVDNDVAQHFTNEFCRWEEIKGKYFVDLKKANQHQLLQAGLEHQNIETSPYSTVLNNENYFSHRKEKGQTGRMLAAIAMK